VKYAIKVIFKDSSCVCMCVRAGLRVRDSGCERVCFVLSSSACCQDWRFFEDVFAEVILSYGLLTTDSDVVCRPAWFRNAFRKDSAVVSNWFLSFSVHTYFA